MARLIPQKQIEEINNFKNDVTVNNNIIISGSLLVSQSIEIGTDPLQQQQITGSVEITGSLTVDGPLELVGQQALDATASFSILSEETKLFGGFTPEEFGANDTTIYVSSTSGNDNNDGRTPQFAVRTVKRAAQLAKSGDDGRFGLPTGSLSSGFRIEVAAGTYLEDNPIELPKNTTVWGAGLRVCKILAKNENEDLFWVNSGNYLAEMTFGNLRVFPSVDNAKSGFAVAFAPNAFITTSPYVQNCSMISNQENSFLELYEDIPPGGGGLNVDGNRIHPDSPLASMVLDAYTQVAPNGVGCQVVGRGFIQLVSFFTNFSAYAVKVLDGGQAVLLNSNTSFGDYGMFASGSRFITGSGGNIDAFNIVRNNYTIIIDTIEDGLSAIPALVTNTNEGIKTTDELQVFISGTSSNQVAEQVKSEYRLVSSIIDSGVARIPNLLAKTDPRGYDTGSVWNISYGTQITGSVTASTSELNILDDKFTKVKETLETGTRVTASYVLGNNVDSLIKVTNETQTAVSFTSSTDTITSIKNNFDTIISIVNNGLTAIPTIVSNNEENIKITDTTQFDVGISSSLDVQNKISSSYAIVSRILQKGIHYVPDTVKSGSLENTTVDYQSGSLALLNNVDFIKNETIEFISSSWSSAVYDELSFGLDIEELVSGSVKDLLFGGNEEAVRIGISQYNKYVSSSYQDKTRIIDGIIYAGRLSQGILQDITYTDPTSEQLNGYDGILDNKQFIQEEVIQYISSSWREFEYDEVKCKRDIGYILDAVATDLRYGGNERSVIAGRYYYDYPSQATTTQLLQTTDGIEYAKDLVEKILEGETFETASAVTQSIYNLIVDNRSLIQEETVNFVDTQFPNLVYLRDKCRRDTGFILDAVATDFLYGGNEKSIRAGLYYREVPSKVNTDQLNQTLDAISYAKSFVDKIVTNEIIENPSVITNTEGRIRATAFTPTTSSVSGTQTQATLISSSFAIVEDIIKQGDDAVLASIAANTPNSFDWGTNTPILVTGLSQLTSSVQISSSFTQSISSNFDSIVTIIESGSSITTDVTIGSASNGLPISQVGIPKDSYGDNLITTVTGTILPETVTITSSLASNIKVNNDIQYTSSITASNEITSSVSSSFAIITDIIKYGISGSQVVSGSSDATTYFEVVTLPSNDSAFYINKNQLQEFDDLDGRYLGEDTGSFEDGVKDPTLTLLRNEMYTFSVNDLGFEDSTVNVPFLIKTKRTEGYDFTYESIGLKNNGIKFGTITFTPLPDTPDTLYYVNPNNVSASGVINIVDSLPLSNEQEFVFVPSKGNIQKIPNTVDNIKITTGSQYTSSLKATVSERNNVSSSFDLVINILNSGSSVSPAVTESIESLTKRTLFTQFTSSLSASLTEVEKVSSSFAIVLDIIQNGTGSLPTKVENTEEYIKVGNVTQFTTSSISGSVDDISFISESFEIVTRIIEFGSGSYPTATNYTTLISSSNTVAAYNLIKQNIDFIQEETIAYLSSSWSTASYNEESCSRDIGYIVSGAAEDLLHNNYSASIVNGKFYLENPSKAETSQLNQTLDGIRYASRLAQNLASNITYVTPSQERLTAKELIVENKDFIKEEAISYLSASWSEFNYNEETCKRDIVHILDATVTDIVYGGNERSINAGVFYYKYPSEATGSQLFPTVTGIKYAGDITEKIIQNNVFEEPSNETVNAYELLSNNRNLIQDEVILYLSASWSDFEYDDVKCRRDVGYIIDATATDLLYGGNERSIEAGEFYYRYPSEATSSQKTQTIDGVRYAQRLSDKVMGNTLLVTASLERRETYDLIFNNKQLIQNEVISYISSSWSQFEYSEEKCRRDTGYILDAVATDTLYGGNERSVTAGEFYYLYPSLAIIDSQDQTDGQREQTLDGILHAAGLVQKLIKNTELVQPTSQSFAVWNAIRDNRELIQKEVTELIDYKYPYFTYNQTKCQRDVGFILDAIATDVLWGGNERSVIAGDYYYRYPSQATTFQLTETIDGIRYAETLVNTIILNEIIETPRIIYNTENNIKVSDVDQFLTSSGASEVEENIISSSFAIITNTLRNGTGSLDSVINYGIENQTQNVQLAYTLIKNNLDFITSESIEYISSSWSTQVYNEVSYSNDIRLIVSGAAEDLIFNSNSSSIQNAINNYEQYSGSDYQTINRVIDGIEYASRVSQNVLRNIEFVTASAEVSASFDLLTKNREFIQEETIAFLSSSWSEVVYNEDKCKRDVGFILDAAATDLRYGGNERSVNAGMFYWTYPSRATNKGIPSEQNQLDPTIDGIRFAGGTAENVIQNLEYTTPSTDVINGIELLRQNKTFIQKETIAFLSSSWSEFEYNDISCSRDLGFILDAVVTDLKYGGNERAIKAAEFYYYIPSVAITEQKPQTIDGIDFAKGISEKIVKQQQLVFPNIFRRRGAQALRDAKKVLQGKAISYTNAAFPNFEYNEEKCYRDTGFIVDAIATDITYGGNERSVEAAKSYYNGVYGDASVVVNEQKKETAETNRYLRTQFQFVARQAPTEEFGSLIITTGHDFSYAGSGVTYKALPPNQGGDGVPDPDKEITEIGGGRVFFTSGNELGDFRIGAGLVINQATGTLQGRTFSRSLFSLVTPFSLALQD